MSYLHVKVVASTSTPATGDNFMQLATPYDPLRHLLTMGIRIEYVENLEVLGQYFHYERLVEVRTGLSPVMERSVLAHEAAHAEMGHEASDWWCRTAKAERLASAMAGRRLVDYHHMTTLQRQGMTEKQMCDELRVARVILRAYLWLSAPAWQERQLAA